MVPSLISIFLDMVWVPLKLKPKNLILCQHSACLNEILKILCLHTLRRMLYIPGWSGLYKGIPNAPSPYLHVWEDRV